MLSLLRVSRISCRRCVASENLRFVSTQDSSAHPDYQAQSEKGEASEKKATDENHKSQAELDAELQQKLEAMSGGGGEAGLELENGKPVAMGRASRNNMFRIMPGPMKG